jgi:hypothetical protein
VKKESKRCEHGEPVYLRTKSAAAISPGGERRGEFISGSASRGIVARRIWDIERPPVTREEGTIQRVLRKSPTVAGLSNSGIEGCSEMSQGQSRGSRVHSSMSFKLQFTRRSEFIRFDG